MHHATSHVTALQKKHARLEKKIKELKCHPAGNDRDMLLLKREKLHLKDEIEKIIHDA